MNLKDLSRYRYIQKSRREKKKDSTEYKKLLKRADAEKKKIEKYILQIDDERIRCLFEMRFIRCYSWIKIAHLYGGNNSADSCKKIVYRKILSLKKDLSLF